jgi:hypothetical protein
VFELVSEKKVVIFGVGQKKLVKAQFMIGRFFVVENFGYNKN